MSGYVADAEMHPVKNAINRAVFSRYAGCRSRNALIFPSVTCNSEKICGELGIFDGNTRFLVVERGMQGTSMNEFIDGLKSGMDDALGVSRPLSEYARLVYGGIEHCGFGRNPANAGKYDFANYDTCSFFRSVNQWLPHQVDAFAHGSPMFFTFDADYYGRGRQHRYAWMRRLDPSGWRRRLFSDESLSGLNETILDEVRDRTCRLMEYLDRIGISVIGAVLYRENKPKCSVMSFLFGRRK